jgi:hypothetical protein
VTLPDVLNDLASDDSQGLKEAVGLARVIFNHYVWDVFDRRRPTDANLFPHLNPTEIESLTHWPQVYVIVFDL